ncbi:MAG: C-terminal target protein [Flavipsychrobacter sp.]|nr:C-terminal target protein [Flavipsychrobacter sp.]
MKKLLFLCLLLASGYCNGQNYQCLQPGVKRYYTNSIGYLRGMRVDSVVTSGSDIVYYPFHTDRGNYSFSFAGVPLDSNGGSWLGKRVLQQTDGTFLFDNMWSDTVTIRTQAHAGDSWVFYNDTTSRYYTATLIAEDTMTVLGTLDSVKTISIHAFTKTGPDPTDPADTLQLMLSKDHGFVNIFDLYTFPYHKPDTLYGPGFDYYLDHLLQFRYYWSPRPSRANSIFSLVDLVNPTYEQLYDWNPGDVFENQVYYGVNDGNYPQEYYYDSITAKTTVAGGTQYSFSGWDANEYFPPFYFWSGGNSGHRFPLDTASKTGTFTISNALLLDTTLMPEESGQPVAQYYLPADAGTCINSPRYILSQTEIYDHSYHGFFEASGVYREYKTGVGLIHYNWNILGGSPPEQNDTMLLYYRKSGTPCGNYYTGFAIHRLAVDQVAMGTVQLMPNPVTNELTITAPVTITHVQLTNAIGQTVFDLSDNRKDVTVSLQHLSAGVYFIRINDTVVRKVVKQ